jgi:hypothetical protein
VLNASARHGLSGLAKVWPRGAKHVHARLNDLPGLALFAAFYSNALTGQWLAVSHG